MALDRMNFISEWSHFKDFATRYALIMFYIDEGGRYQVNVVKEGILFFCQIAKSTPEAVDFEQNFMA